MKSSEIRAMSEQELHKALEDARENLFNLRFQWATSQVQDHNVIKAARHDIARLETILRERQLAGGE
jgi:large subunit ribosomal protein L29